MATQKTTAVAIGALVVLLGIGGTAVLVHRAVGSNSINPTNGQTVDLAAAPANSVATFSDGITVECVAMSEITFGKMAWATELIGQSPTPVQATQWWKPDGSITTAPKLGQDVVYLAESAGRRGVRFVFDTNGPAAGEANLSIRIPNSQGYASTVRTFGQTRRTNFAASLPNDVEKLDIRLGIAKGEWRREISTPVVTTSEGTAISTTQPATQPAMQQRVTYGKIAAGANGGCTVEMIRENLKFGDRQRSIRVITTDGKQIWCDSSQSSGGPTTYHFACPKEKLASIEWLSRPYEWATLSGVSLKPKQGATPPAR